MRHDEILEKIRVCEGTRISATCMDCGEAYVGDLGVRYIETCQGPGLEVCVCAEHMIHAIARVPVDVLPIVKSGEKS